MPEAVRINFPELIVLGPEQLKVIHESKHYSRCVLVGEAGCGKTFILLYLLYKNTSKFLSESYYKMVVFMIPEEKTEFRAYVEKFVEDFCNRKYIYIQSFGSFCDFSITQDVELILLDEIYCTHIQHTLDEISHVSAKIVVALGLIDGQPFETLPYIIPSDWTTFNLRSSYRNPSNISSLCRKLRQLTDGKLFSSIPFLLHMALDSNFKVNDEDSIQIKHIDYCSEIGKEIAEKKEKTLLVADDEDAFKSDFLTEYTIKVQVTQKNYQKFVQKLEFTGVQYKTVVILLTKSARVDVLSLALLYYSISRSTHRVILLTPDPESYKTLLAATPVDLKVFEKLRRHQNVPKEDLLLLTTENERCEALVLTSLTENWNMLTSLIETFKLRSEASSIQKHTIQFLLHAFPRFEKGEILNIISKNFGGAIDIGQMLGTYINSSKTISKLPNLPTRRRLREQFMGLMPGRDLYTDFVHLTKSRKHSLVSGVSDLLDASFIWGDRRMFMQYVQMTRNDLHLLSRCLTELSSNLPENMKKLFKWVELSPEEIISLQQAEQVFAELSALTKNGNMKMSLKKYKTWNAGIPCCETGTKLFSGNDNFRQTFKFAFCNFFKGFFRNFTFDCQNSLYCDVQFRDEIKYAPITKDEAIQLLKKLINSNKGINSESIFPKMSVLLARIYLTNIEVNLPAIE